MTSSTIDQQKETHCFSYNFEVQSDVGEDDPTFLRDAAQILIADIGKLSVNEVATRLEHWDSYGGGEEESQ